MDNRVARYMVALIALLKLTGCDDLLQTSEAMRVTSPDGRVDALVMKGSVNATTPTVYQLYIVPRGKGEPEYDPELVGERFMDFDVSWRRDKFLDVSYKEGAIFSFSNFWRSKELDDYSYIVEIRLNPPSDSFSLPF